MSGASVHLILNHVPVFSTLFGIGILGWGLFKRSSEIRKIGTVLLIVGAVASYIAFESGEAAEEQIEGSTISISHETLHDHEEAAEVAVWFSVITGLLSLVSLMFSNLNIRFKNTLYGVLMLSAILTFFVLIFTAYKGGELQHEQEMSGSVEYLESVTED